MDVTTHLVDIVMWGCFPQEIIDYQKEIEIKKSRRWPTEVSGQQFEKVTRLRNFPDFLEGELNDKGLLPCYSNGEIVYTVKGIYASVSVQWNFEAPEGGGDTHYSVIKGSKAKIIIRQGKEQNYRPEVYVEAAGASKEQLAQSLKKAVASVQNKYPGVDVEQLGDIWHVVVPDEYRVGHEAHFGQVTENYLKYLVEGKLPDWEVPNMITKYYTTTRALELATEK